MGRCHTQSLRTAATRAATLSHTPPTLPAPPRHARHAYHTHQRATVPKLGMHAAHHRAVCQMPIHVHKEQNAMRKQKAVAPVKDVSSSAEISTKKPQTLIARPLNLRYTTIFSANKRVSFHANTHSRCGRITFPLRRLHRPIFVYEVKVPGRSSPHSIRRVMAQGFRMRPDDFDRYCTLPVLEARWV